MENIQFNIVAADTGMVKDQVGSTNILYPSVKRGPVLLHCVAEDM